MSGSVADARIGRGFARFDSVGRSVGTHESVGSVTDARVGRFGRDARIGHMSVKTHGSVVGRSRCIVHGP